MTVVLAFGHTSRVGKDYCATQIQRVYGHKRIIKRYSFAELLKQIVHLLKLTLHPSYYDEHPEMRQVSIPGFLKTAIDTWTSFGDHVRAYDPYIWVRPVMAKITSENPDIALITDLRFPVETDILRGTAKRSPQEYQVHLMKLICTDRKPLSTVADHALDDFTDWDLIVQQPWGQVVRVWRDVQTYLSDQGILV